MRYTSPHPYMYREPLWAVPCVFVRKYKVYSIQDQAKKYPLLFVSVKDKHLSLIQSISEFKQPWQWVKCYDYGAGACRHRRIVGTHRTPPLTPDMCLRGLKGVLVPHFT